MPCGHIVIARGGAVAVVLVLISAACGGTASAAAQRAAPAQNSGAASAGADVAGPEGAGRVLWDDPDAPFHAVSLELERSGDYDGAERAKLRALDQLERRGDDAARAEAAELHREMASLHLTAGKPEAALVDLRQAATIHPGSASKNARLAQEADRASKEAGRNAAAARQRAVKRARATAGREGGRGGGGAGSSASVDAQGRVMRAASSFEAAAGRNTGPLDDLAAGPSGADPATGVEMGTLTPGGPGYYEEYESISARWQRVAEESAAVQSGEAVMESHVGEPQVLLLRNAVDHSTAHAIRGKVDDELRAKDGDPHFCFGDGFDGVARGFDVTFPGTGLPSGDPFRCGTAKSPENRDNVLQRSVEYVLWRPGEDYDVDFVASSLADKLGLSPALAWGVQVGRIEHGFRENRHTDCTSNQASVGAIEGLEQPLRGPVYTQTGTASGPPDKGSAPPADKRFASAVVFLGGTSSGGGIGFPELKLALPAQDRAAVVWHSLTASGDCDERALFEIEGPDSFGHTYVMRLWYQMEAPALTMMPLPIAGSGMHDVVECDDMRLGGCRHVVFSRKSRISFRRLQKAQDSAFAATQDSASQTVLSSASRAAFDHFTAATSAMPTNFHAVRAFGTWALDAAFVNLGHWEGDASTTDSSGGYESQEHAEYEEEELSGTTANVGNLADDADDDADIDETWDERDNEWPQAPCGPNDSASKELAGAVEGVLLGALKAARDSLKSMYLYTLGRQLPEMLELEEMQATIVSELHHARGCLSRP